MNKSSKNIFEENLKSMLTTAIGDSDKAFQDSLTSTVLEEIRQQRRRNRTRLLATAASVVLVLAGALVWRAMRGGVEAEPPETVVAEVSMEEIEREVYRAGLAAELLAMGDFIRKYPGGEEFAKERYTYVAQTFPETEGANTAKLRLEELGIR